jgi:hypothetical protein
MSATARWRQQIRHGLQEAFGRNAEGNGETPLLIVAGRGAPLFEQRDEMRGNARDAGQLDLRHLPLPTGEFKNQHAGPLSLWKKI